ncbi:hypothetical protein [Campylobacter sp. MG1]|uniref:hypothetical protein n=1 Tax=Campylobacter sp. MG1 TaxID=2976332 RepID=UPI00226C712C|nr:hypothetical protein [Campylobacter sp. MG1]
MNLSNFKELINAEIINSTQLSELSGFSAKLSNLSYANAFFTNNEDEAKMAAILGAYAIVSEKKLEIIDSDIAYFRVDSLDIAIKRLIKFLCIDKYVFLINELDCECFKRLNYQPLKSNFKDDLELFCSNHILVSCDEEYLKLLGLSYKKPEYSINLVKNSSFFYQDIRINNEYHQNINIPKIFIKSVAIASSLNINYSNVKLLDYVFFNEENIQVKMSEASKVVFFENNEIVISEIKKYLDLFEITELKNYTFMLYKGDKIKFLEQINNKQDKGLFL